MDFFVQCGTLIEYDGEDEYVKIPDTEVGKCESECGFVKLYDRRLITVIGKAAFVMNQKIKEVFIPDQVKKIASFAFYYCKNLERITIPGNVEIIEERAFDNCTSLQEVTLGYGVRSIGKKAFLDCESLKSITVPESVTEIGEQALGYLYSWTDPKQDGFVIYGKKDTAAHRYAMDNDIDFIEI
ncbi:MAG: leucine-rich repeat domain-containing protein [Ruminococcus sp.]|nr:leucine-rich repeat domain-containing protein [Ruminococcus sp.]